MANEINSVKIPDITYKIYVPTAPYAGDAIKSNQEGIYGNIDGIRSILPILAELGYSCIEIGPVYDAQLGDEPIDGAYNPDSVSAAMGYAANDLFSIHPYYGDFDTYKKMVEEAHELGLKIRQDVVLNHISSENTLFKKSRTQGSEESDYFFWRDPIAINDGQTALELEASIIEKEPEPWLKLGGKDKNREKLPFLRIPLLDENDNPRLDDLGNPIFTEYMPFIRQIENGQFEICRNNSGQLLFPPSDIRPFFGQTAWHLDDETGRSYLGRFGSTMPDLNIAAAKNHVLESCKKWLKLGIDGFRLDAAFWIVALPNTTGNAIYDAAKCSNPPAHGTTSAAFSFANVGGQLRLDLGSEASILFWKEFVKVMNEEAKSLQKGGLRKTDELTFEFENGDKLAIWEKFYPQLAVINNDQSIIRAYTAMTESVNSLDDLRSIITTHQNKFGSNTQIAFTYGNHDTKTLAQRLSYNDNEPAKRLLMEFLSCLPGEFSVFQGHDLGLPMLSLQEVKANDVYGIVADGKHQPSDGSIIDHNSGRAAIPYFTDNREQAHKRFMAYPEEFRSRCYESQLVDQASFLMHVKQLIQQRRDDPYRGLPGTVTFIDIIENPNVLAFSRTVEGSIGTKTMLFNFSKASTTIELGGHVVNLAAYGSMTIDNSTHILSLFRNTSQQQ